MNEEPGTRNEGLAASGKFYSAMATAHRPLTTDHCRRAYYDLSRQPASWDFWTWLTYARKRGATEVVFDMNAGWSYPDEPRERQEHLFWNVVIPICKLWRMPYSFGPANPLRDITCPHIYQPEVPLKHEDLVHFPLSPVWRPTVTLRQSVKHPERDSDLRVWLPFAERIGAIVIEDAWQKPISMEERFQLYRSAPVNYFANNGPGAAAIWSNLPAVMVNPPGVGQCIEWIPRGTQYPFSTNRQVMLWNEVTLENLLHAHEQFTNEERRTKNEERGTIPQ